jgi:hypothetical protein
MRRASVELVLYSTVLPYSGCDAGLSSLSSSRNLVTGLDEDTKQQLHTLVVALGNFEDFIATSLCSYQQPIYVTYELLSLPHHRRTATTNHMLTQASAVQADLATSSALTPTSQRSINAQNKHARCPARLGYHLYYQKNPCMKPRQDEPAFPPMQSWTRRTICYAAMGCFACPGKKDNQARSLSHAMQK